jgi:hypothetical protein
VGERPRPAGVAHEDHDVGLLRTIAADPVLVTGLGAVVVLVALVVCEVVGRIRGTAEEDEDL